jgi:DNA-binding protein H-NS
MDDCNARKAGLASRHRKRPRQESDVDINLDSLSLKELKDLQSRVARAIATYEERRKRDALVKLEEVARDLGYSLPELVGAQALRGKLRGAAAKYANPADPSQTWTGRGRQPDWFKAAIEAGRTPADLAV